MTHHDLGLFAMNKKGLSVLETLIDLSAPPKFVCVGRDSNVEEDYADAIISLCEKNKIPVFERNSELPSSEFKLAVGWRWLIPETKNLLIIHDSLLPKYRGFAPLVNMLINGEPIIGATLLYASDTYDTGPIISQSQKRISHPVRISEAIEVVIECYRDLTRFLVNGMKEGKISEGNPQDESNASYGLWRDELDYFIDWSQSSEQIQRHVYATGFPYTGAKSYLNQNEVNIHDCDPVQDVKIENRCPGKVIFMENSHPVVVCGSGLLKITSMSSTNEGIDLPKFRSRFH